MSDSVETYIDQNRESFQNDLCDLLRIASVSTDSQFKSEVHRAGNWLVDRLASIGFNSELIETSGHPIVYAESPPVPDAPTVLVYGHYDVQPPDPLDQWKTPPFEPDIRDGQVFARGATDDKGQMLTHVFSTQAWAETNNPLPLQIKFLIEGEEECGSKGLWEFLDGKLDGKFDNGSISALEKIKCDVAVISDCAMYGPDIPAITYGLKGISYFELRLQGPDQDLHSGAFGGAVTNPANALTQMLAKLIDENGRVQIPGFYDDVIPITDQERQQFADLNFDEQQFKDSIGVDEVTGEQGYTTLERRWARPTFDINGLWSGYQGEGAKTVLPATAAAKFSFRLVADQDPQKILQSLREYLAQICPAGIKLELIDMHGAPGVTIPLDSPFMMAAGNAIEKGFGKRPVFVRTGGSIPVVTAFSERLGVDTLLLGWGQDDDNMHSPNEKFSLADFHRGIKASSFLWSELAKVPVAVNA
jgi:succinyl-diaminopimelate desuccinylase